MGQYYLKFEASSVDRKTIGKACRHLPTVGQKTLGLIALGKTGIHAAIAPAMPDRPAPVAGGGTDTGSAKPVADLNLGIDQPEHVREVGHR